MVTIKANQEIVNSVQPTKKEREKLAKNNFKSVDGSSVSMTKATKDKVDEKKDQARKQAMKLMSDAWGKDQKSATNRENLETMKALKQDDINDLRTKIKNLEAEMDLYKEEYGIESDSLEQTDLDLLKKYQENKSGASADSFSDDEIARLRELESRPFSKYQMNVLELNDAKASLELEIRRRQNEINALTMASTDAGIDQLKSQDMIKAQEAIGKMKASANREIFNLLMHDGKEAVDQKAEEEKVKAEEKEKEKEEQDKRLEEDKEKRKEQEILIEADAFTDKMEMNISLKKSNDSQVTEAQKNIEKIMSDNKLINEDIKGIEIDLNF